MTNFTCDVLPGRVLFGAGVREQLSIEIERLGCAPKMRGKPQITPIPQMIAGKGLTVGRVTDLYGTKTWVAEKPSAILSRSAKSA